MIMNEEKIKEDPVKLHKDGYTLCELGKYEEAKSKLLKASQLYQKANNFFDASTMLYKAGECAYLLKNYEDALEHFLGSADLSFDKGFDRFGLSALEYARDCYKALENKEKVVEIEKKIKEAKERLF